ncbi:hypothetical protein FSP39_016940 [Pinctada imbricata]|uniref:TIR domain-containing protein n=1 Tax=Pinctada imbricata TaxID=66713 RepID=A0AA89C908_PINIB|nr:hypothetical protein FSP39_016940 [Pinctada imbricata]
MDIEIQPLLDDFEETGHKTVLNPPEAQTSFQVIHEELDDAVQVHSADQETTDEYDIFISHASEDLEDVKPLCNELENRYKLKCMLADRDFDIGVPVENNLKLKMEQSKKILLIISPGFVESFWCKSEMMRAFMMMSSGKKDLIIPVLLKPVLTEMPPFLEYYTYIDASKTDDLSCKIFESFHNPIFPYTREEIRRQNGARLMTNECRKAQRSCRGVAWAFPPLDESEYESEEGLTALERTIFDYCLKYRKDWAIIALVRDNYKHARCLARPTSNFIFESLKVDEEPDNNLDKETVVKQVHNFIFNNRQIFIDWNERMPVTEINRHNTWMQKQCVCELFLSVHKQEKRGKKSQ